MVLNNIPVKKREKILNFFREKFNINLEEYDEDEILVVFEEVKNTIHERLVSETNKNKFLLSEIRKQKLMLSFLDL